MKKSSHKTKHAPTKESKPTPVSPSSQIQIQTQKPKRRILRTVLIILGIIILILIGLVAYAYVRLSYAPVATAQLEYGSGEVFVNNVVVYANQSLKENDIIETKNGRASVVLHESAFIQLEPNTRIELSDLDKEKPVVNQLSGKAWINLVHTHSIKELTFNAANTTTVINGTMLGIDMSWDTVTTLVVKGSVSFWFSQEKIVTVVKTGSVAILNKTTGKTETRELTVQEKLQLKDMVVSAREDLEQHQQKLISMYPELMYVVRKASGFTDDQIQTYLSDLNGKANKDVDDLLAQSPLKTEPLVAFATIVKEIQDFNQYIRELDAMASKN